jgi:hypothetical protein
MYVRHVVICGLTWVYNNFPHYLIHGMIFGKKVTEHKMCVLIFSTNLVEKFLVVRRTERDMIKNVYGSCCKILIVLFKL